MLLANPDPDAKRLLREKVGFTAIHNASVPSFRGRHIAAVVPERSQEKFEDFNYI
jgi:hypothetical protein